MICTMVILPMSVLMRCTASRVCRNPCPIRQEFALDLIHTSDFHKGHTADLGVDKVHCKQGVLQPLSYTARVVGGDSWETLGTCNVTRECCLHVADYTCPALFTSLEKHFLQRCSTPSPYISLLPPVSSHELPNPAAHEQRLVVGAGICAPLLWTRVPRETNLQALRS